MGLYLERGSRGYRDMPSRQRSDEFGYKKTGGYFGEIWHIKALNLDSIGAHSSSRKEAILIKKGVFSRMNISHQTFDSSLFTALHLMSLLCEKLHIF